MKIIRGLMEEMGFNGIAFLVDIKKKLLYLLGTRDIDIYSDTKSFITFASFNASINYQKVVNYAGVGFTITGLELPISHNVLSSGVYVYDIEKREIIYQKKEQVGFVGYQPEWYQYDRNSTFEFDRSVPVSEMLSEDGDVLGEFKPEIKKEGIVKVYQGKVKGKQEKKKNIETSDDYLHRKGYLAD